MKKKPARNFIVIFSLSVATIASVLLIFFFTQPPKPAGKITLFLHLYNDPVRKELEKAFFEFEKQYPEVELEYFIEPYLNLKRERGAYFSNNVLSDNHIVISSLLAGDIQSNETISPGAWTGMAWNLYYNENVLKNLGLSEEDIANLKTLNLSEFIDYFSPLLSQNQTIFSVSSRYYIQYLSWLQHLKLEQTAGSMPEDFSLETWNTTIDSFIELASEGVMNSDHPEVNEASTVIDMFKGEALFTLYTNNIYSIFLPGDRLLVHPLSFPGSFNQKWHVGSGFYLVTTAPEKPNRKILAAEQELISYLRSDELIEDFLGTTGIKLNPPGDSATIWEFSSISDRVRESELQALIDDIRHR